MFRGILCIFWSVVNIIHHFFSFVQPLKQHDTGNDKTSQMDNAFMPHVMFPLMATQISSNVTWLQYLFACLRKSLVRSKNLFCELPKAITSLLTPSDRCIWWVFTVLHFSSICYVTDLQTNSYQKSIHNSQ